MNSTRRSPMKTGHFFAAVSKIASFTCPPVIISYHGIFFCSFHFHCRGEVYFHSPNSKRMTAVSSAAPLQAPEKRSEDGGTRTRSSAQLTEAERRAGEHVVQKQPTTNWLLEVKETLTFAAIAGAAIWLLPPRLSLIIVALLFAWYGLVSDRLF
ncbi:unnamed protein product [Amoebophrya sp. A25]|nr:unnamed protein product [Amoebophrya sp. A25]|eukprot:GSA25T00017456001.1